MNSRTEARYGSDVLEQLSQTESEGFCDDFEVPQGYIPFPAFDTAQVCAVESTIKGEFFLRLLAISA